jgi:hypothetical protein
VEGRTCRMGFPVLVSLLKNPEWDR